MTTKTLLPGIFLCLSISLSGFGQKATSMKLDDLQKLINAPGPAVKVINFWATWCAPCVKELPFFEKLNLENKEVKVTLVSMDYDLDPNPDKVNRFIARKKLQSDVVILTERDANSWIDKIDKEWSGAIPATLIVGADGKRKFVQGEVTEEELSKLIKEINN